MTSTADATVLYMVILEPSFGAKPVRWGESQNNRSIKLRTMSFTNLIPKKMIKTSEKMNSSKIIQSQGPIFKRQWPIILTFFVFSANNSFQSVAFLPISQIVAEYYHVRYIFYKRPRRISFVHFSYHDSLLWSFVWFCPLKDRIYLIIHRLRIHEPISLTLSKNFLICFVLVWSKIFKFFLGPGLVLNF